MYKFIAKSKSINFMHTIYRLMTACITSDNHRMERSRCMSFDFIERKLFVIHYAVWKIINLLHILFAFYILS